MTSTLKPAFRSGLLTAMTYANSPQQQAQQQPFPPTLQPVPEDARLAETFAFTPGALAVGATLGLFGFIVALASGKGATSMNDLYYPLACTLGAILFGFWEVMRRLNRTSLVFYGNQMGVYRGGKLVQVGSRNQIMVYQLSVINTIRELMAFGMLGFGGMIMGAVTVGRNLGVGLTFLGAGVGLTGAFISSIYGRIACRHFFVPKGNGTEQVMFTRGIASRFGL